jgi:hypothetical protein
LDDLLEHAVEGGSEPEEALAAVIDCGIIAWYAGQDEKVRKRLNLPKIKKADADLKKLEDRLTKVERLKESLKADLLRERKRHAVETAALSEENKKLEARIDALRKKPGETGGSKPESKESHSTASTEREIEEPAKREHPRCSFPGCDRNRFVRGRGFCGKHWKQWRAGKIKSAEEYQKRP